MPSTSSLPLCCSTLLLLLLALTAQENPKCILNSPHGSTNLNLLQRELHYTTTGIGFTYYLSFCTDAQRACDGKDYSVVMETSGFCAGLGIAENAKVTLFNDTRPDLGVVYSLTGGKVSKDAFGEYELNAKVFIRCDPTVTGDLSITFLEQTMETMSDGTRHMLYLFETKSDKGCVSGSPSFFRWGVGATVLTIACVAVFLYFVVGTLVCKFALKKQGIEIIPNVHFWKAIPLLVLDGFRLIIDCFKKIGKKGSSESGSESIAASGSSTYSTI